MKGVLGEMGAGKFWVLEGKHRGRPGIPDQYKTQKLFSSKILTLEFSFELV